MSNKQEEYEVFIEGFICAGNSSPGKYLGIYCATSPKAACRKALKNNGYDMNYWDSSRCTWWDVK